MQNSIRGTLTRWHRLALPFVFVLVMLIGNTKTLVFHAPGCKQASCNTCSVRFKSFTEAVLYGYSPCGFCRRQIDEILRKR